MCDGHGSDAFSTLNAGIDLLSALFNVEEDDVVAGGVHNLDVINEVDVV